MVFAALAQVLLALSPLAELRGGSTDAHVEAAGIAIHHSHNEANCVACAARVLLSSSDVTGRTTVFVVASALAPAAASGNRDASSDASGLFSRAPPVSRA